MSTAPASVNTSRAGARFFAAVLFTCKAFDVDAAVAYTRGHFRSDDLEHASF